MSCNLFDTDVIGTVTFDDFGAVRWDTPADEKQFVVGVDLPILTEERSGGACGPNRNVRVS